MNLAVRSWNRHLATARSDGPDSVAMDDETLLLKKKEAEMPKSLREKYLPPDQFNSVIRQIKTAELDRVKLLQTATYNTLKRLGVDRNAKRAKRGVPEGSDQGNTRSVIDWMDRVNPGDKRAVQQVIAIDATCCRRVSG